MDLNKSVAQGTIEYLVILAIIVMGIIVLGRKRPKRKKPIKEEVNDPFSLEKEDLLKNLRDEFN